MSLDDSHNNTTKIYKLVVKMITMVEEGCDTLQTNQSNASLKNITDVLNNLVTLIVKLHKLHDISPRDSLSNNDKQIISAFIKKHTSNINQPLDEKGLSATK